MTLQAGRELDRLVAEKVMGAMFTEDGEWALEEDGRVIRDYPPTYPGYWHPSINIDQAWDVVEHLAAKGYLLVTLRNGFHGDSMGWACSFAAPNQSGRRAFTNAAPHAICLAALRAVGETP